MIFELFSLLRVQFNPRIANDKGTKLWRIDADADYHELNALSQNKINLTLIQTYWKESVRMISHHGEVFIVNLFLYVLV